MFKTTEKHEELRAKIRAWAEEVVTPRAHEHDQTGNFPTEAVKQLGKGGLDIMGLPFETKYGGAGFDNIAYAIAVEELSRVDGSMGVILSAHCSLGSYPIYAFGTEEQKKKYLVPLAEGKKLGAFGLTEPEAGSDAGGTETTAELKGDHYILNGEKIFITNSIEAESYVVFAVTTPGIGTKGISAFIVEKGWEGFEFGEKYDKLGIRASATAQLLFDNVKVPKENLLGKEGQGFKIAMQTLDGGRIGIAAQALGIAQGAYEAAVAYSKERIQFGRPIAQQQAIAFKLADMATKLRAARLLIYSAAAMKDRHEPYGTESAMAKLYASEIGLEVVNQALQIHGGNGYIKGAYIVERPKAPVAAAGPMAKKGPITGERRNIIFKEGSAQDKVDALVAALKKDGIDFSVGIDINTPIVNAERVVSAGKGIGAKENMKLVEDLAKAAGAAIGCSRPVAEELKYLPIIRYVGMSGQKFNGNLYIACGISGANQHLKGIKNASIIVAINVKGSAKIFKNADYGIVGDVKEILPLLTKALDTGAKKPAEVPYKKMKKITPKKTIELPKIYVCSGCGYEYNPFIGDPESEVAPGTDFTALPDEWVCPECSEEKANFIKA